MEKVEQFSRKFQRGTTSPYPWRQIAVDGGVWRLLNGVDYNTPEFPSTERRLQMTAHEWAKRNGLGAHAITGPGWVEVQFYVPEQRDARLAAQEIGEIDT